MSESRGKCTSRYTGRLMTDGEWPVCEKESGHGGGHQCTQGSVTFVWTTDDELEAAGQLTLDGTVPA